MTNHANDTILVTGATGTVGAQVAHLLLDRGARVRVGVRTPAAAAELGRRGAEVVALDLEDDASVRAALAGVGRALLLSPFVERFHATAVRNIEAARAAGVDHVVRISALGADPDGALEIAQWHGAADRALAHSGVGFTVLQPTFFQDNLIKFHADSVRRDGAFYGASAGGATAYISSADIAASAAAVLLAPAAHAGATYVLTGGEAVTDARVAELATAAIGKPVRYVDLPGEQLAEGMRSNGAPGWLVDALVGLEAVKAAGWAAEATPAVRELTGRAPEAYASFLARNADRLR